MRIFALYALAALSGCATAMPDSPLGRKPSYLEVTTEGVANQAAILRRIYTPGLDDSFVPQGLAIAEGYVLVSSYKPTPDLKANTGPCRVFRIDPATGKDAGAFDMPVGACTHAGGLAYLGNGMLVLFDTRQLFRIDLARALATGKAEGAMKAVKITGELRGSFGAFDGKDAWVGTWTREAAKSRMFRLDPRLFDDYDGQTVNEARAMESVPIPLESQGAAFDGKGNLWVSASSSLFGKLYRLDRKGAVQAEYPMMIGLEDLEFDAQGMLWSVAESGTRKYMHWTQHFPFVFQLDTARLR